MIDTRTDRRRFLSYFSGVGLTSTLLPGVLWAQVVEQEAAEVTADMIRHAAAVSGQQLTEEQAEGMAEGVNRNLQGYAELRAIHIDSAVAPPLNFSPLVPGLELDREALPFRPTEPTGIRRPSDLEELAFWPLTSLAELLRTRQVTSMELTDMYLARLERYNPTLNFVVTFTDRLARREAERADAEIQAGHYRGVLHGIPWGAKDILAVRDYPTTWGSNAFKAQTTDYEATVVRQLREAGAVLIAKLATGELASGDRWYGGRTRNPWDATKGSSGSSAGPGSATVAGCVGFAIGTETSGSILSPSVACGATGLRPTFGRVSRFGAMSLRWTGDRLGPICRTAEDCAVVFNAIALPDEQDSSVMALPFNWNARSPVEDLSVAYLSDAFEDDPAKGADWRANDRRALDALREAVELHPMDTPLRDFPMDALRPLSAESTAAFDEFLRAGREAELSRPARGAGWRVGRTVPAVEYLQAQRVRGMMIRDLMDGMGGFDVIVAPYMDSRASLGERRPGAGGAGRRGTAPRRRSATSQFFQLANHATLPAVAVRTGFGDDGLPTGMVFVGKPFSESKVLRMAKAFQDATEHHLRTPELA